MSVLSDYDREIIRVRRRIWRTVRQLVDLRAELRSAYCPVVDEALDETIAALIRSYAAPLVPMANLVDAA